MSFMLKDADWIPEKVRAKMKVIHKNRISRRGEFSVACQEASNTLENQRRAVLRIAGLIEEAERAVGDDEWEASKLEYTDWVIQKKIKEGREKDIEKRAEAIKDRKRRSRERTRNRKIRFD